MSKKLGNRGLSRGLADLIGENELLDSDTTTNVEQIILEDLKPNPYQPRKYFDDEALKELSESIKKQGIFQPLAVRKTIVGYEIIAGERRYRAAKMAGLETVPCVIYDYDEQQMMEVALIENIQREDLSILEEAESYQMLLDNLGYTQQELADQVGKSRSHIANILRILKLDDFVQEQIKQNKITMGHVKTLVTIDDFNIQREITEIIISEGLNVRQAEELVKNYKESNSESDHQKVKSKKVSPHKRLENMMREKLGTKVQISGREKGSIKIDFSSQDELEALLELLNVI
jgi:ParB family chromosome partitioning protein